MINLECIICNGRVEIVSGFRSITKEIRCTKCGFESGKKREPTVFVKRKPLLDSDDWSVPPPKIPVALEGVEDCDWELDKEEGKC